MTDLTAVMDRYSEHFPTAQHYQNTLERIRRLDIVVTRIRAEREEKDRERRMKKAENEAKNRRGR